MAWSTPPRSLFLAKGQANQFSFSFGDVWKGPQSAVAKLDATEGGGANTKILVTQWQGTANEAVFGGPSKQYYVLGINNSTGANVWFHLEGGVLA